MIIMSKRMRSTSSPLLPPPPQLNDIITEDGILCLIVSSLSLREAARTSVLSPRWRHIWTRIPNLNFDIKNMLGPDTARLLGRPSRSSNPLTSEERYALVIEKTEEFIKNADSVLEQQRRRCYGLDTFRVIYHLHKTHSKHLDAWLRFAVEAKTRVLSLDLYLNLYPPPRDSPPIEPYAFPCHMFAGLGGSSLVTLCLNSCSLKPPHGFDGLNNLKRLVLVKVDATAEDIDCLLSNCFTLEYLRVKMCPQLVELCISHPLSRLSALDVYCCDQLRKIEINARNLISFGYIGDWVDFKFRESSQLRLAYFWFETSVQVDFATTKLQSSMPRLESLYFNMNDVSKVADLPKDSIGFACLTFLDWSVDSKISLVCLAYLLNFAPFLEEFVLDCRRSKGEKLPPGPREFTRLHGHSRTRLRTVKIIDFYGDNWQIEIAIYFLNNATELKSMKIMAGRESFEKIREVVAEYLIHEVPVNVNFVTL